jgi:hypothetical protein
MFRIYPQNIITYNSVCVRRYTIMLTNTENMIGTPQSTYKYIEDKSSSIWFSGKTFGVRCSTSAVHPEV